MMSAFAAFLAPALRYIMLAVALYVVTRMVLALFFKKTTDPIRAKLISDITNESISLYERETSIGRNKKCDIVLPYETISRLHAVIVFRTKGFVIFDTFSKSGVRVNGKKIDGKALLNNGDMIDIGGITYTLHEGRYKYIKDKSPLLGTPSYAVTLVFLALFNIFSMILNIKPGSDYNLQIAIVFIGYIVLQWAYFLFASFVLRIHNFELEMIAFQFASIGLAIGGSIYPDEVIKQFIAVVIGVFGFCVILFMLRFIDAMKAIRWLLAGASILVLGVTLVLAETTNGAKNWLSLGSFSVQPSELVKVAFIFAGAATLEKLQSVRHLTMYIIFSAVCVGELFLMYDFGTALIFFFTFSSFQQ